MRNALNGRIGWLILILLDILLLYVHFNHTPVRVRPGVTPMRESLLHAFVFLLLLTGFWFRWSPLVLWPSFAAMISLDLEVNGMSALVHTMSFVMMGVIVGAIHVVLRGPNASSQPTPPTS